MKIHLTTLGCPKNQVDSELMLGMLARAGHEVVPTAEAADCLIVNTCAFIDRAREESVHTILDLAQLKGQDRSRSLIVTGCLSQRYGREVLDEIPEVDAILGTSELDRILDLVGQTEARRDWATNAPPGYLYDAAMPRLLTRPVPYAYVKIAEGCDMGCAFCAIPQFRGAHRSRPLADIVREVHGLAERGIREVILVSQDTLAYGKDLRGNGDIGDLLLALSDTAIPWIRPMYLHPAHVSDRLLAKWRRARVLPYLDMPVQHADDGILRAMRRGVTARRMREIFRAFRDASPDLTLRTTVLVGFPGESETAFENLLEFVEEVRFDRLGVFTYSPEEGTPAAGMAQVPREVSDERARIVQEYQERIAWERQQALVGTVQTVLVDGPSEDPAFAWEGRLAGQAPEIDGVVYLRHRDLVPGSFARVRVVEVEGYELIAEPLATGDRGLP
ncbi:MAG: 30S ribosomal protein S12 methylthiotransferase RimO [Candidatus Rokubacteria bacterium]|nr:30S ribosomal protein S12 methylthiotransferase RimO [Candidatus Rokubacteria bacterium]